MPVKIEKGIRLADVFTVGIPLISLIVIFVTMREDIKLLFRSDKEIVERQTQLTDFNENIGQILTAHTTQLAVNTDNIDDLEDTDDRLEENMEKMQLQLDQMRR